MRCERTKSDGTSSRYVPFTRLLRRSGDTDGRHLTTCVAPSFPVHMHTPGTIHGLPIARRRACGSYMAVLLGACHISLEGASCAQIKRPGAHVLLRISRRLPNTTPAAVACFFGYNFRSALFTWGNGVVVFRPTTRSRPRLGSVVRCGDLTLQRKKCLCVRSVVAHDMNLWR